MLNSHHELQLYQRPIGDRIMYCRGQQNVLRKPRFGKIHHFYCTLHSQWYKYGYLNFSSNTQPYTASWHWINRYNTPRLIVNGPLGISSNTTQIHGWRSIRAITRVKCTIPIQFETNVQVLRWKLIWTDMILQRFKRPQNLCVSWDKCNCLPW